MSRKLLGTDWFCDLCDKLVHTDEEHPKDWTVVETRVTYGISGFVRSHLCEKCWISGPVDKIADKKSFLMKLRKAFGCEPSEGSK